MSKKIHSYILFIFLSFSSFANAEGVPGEGTLNKVAGDQLTMILKSYFTPAVSAVSGLKGDMVPFVAYITSFGEFGHHDLSGVEPTSDPEVVDILVAKLYKKIYDDRFDYEAFGIFAVTEVELEGEKKKALTVILEQKEGVAVQRVWPFHFEDGKLVLDKPSQIPAVSVIFVE